MKTLNRTKRLKLAPQWISAYTGKNLVRGYARYFSVDLICAITELRMLGSPVPEEYELAVKRSIADRSLQRKKKREAKAAAANPSDDISNGEFTFIAGYTSNDVPYGIRSEETDGLDSF
ncbi:hypothetical protein [Chitinophaga tropicalis]|uniref:Uncharacterized protein n=1 Tax=Chitinophaga tropicalis TaxID=2683588 RepID=A0A7K1UE31_9BACT|nr:hypothetical protein [Chitinophaga tropicalis]MVT12530.1 hypothetical protein [Chitinophaga tropicalis]